MIGHFHQTLIFTFLLVLQGSLAYVQPIHIRYSDEQLKELEDNPRPPNRFDQPRTLIDNPYGAQIYYEEILPEDEEILAARNTELQNESFRRGPFENQESFRRGPFENHENIPNHHFNSPDGIQNFWNHHMNHMNPNFYRIHMQTVSPNGFNNNYYLNYYDQQYSEYLRELLYSFYFQKQVLSELINQQEQQLQILRAQFDQLNGAITNTEHQIQQIHSPPSASSSPVPPSPSPVPPNQLKPSSTTATTQSQSLTTSVPTQQQQQQFTYQSGQSGSEIKPSSEIGIEKETETEQTPKEELNTNTEDNLENNNEQTNNNNNDDNNNVII